MIIMGDLHLKKSEPYLKHTVSFLKWINEKYPEEILIQMGDTFDSSGIAWIIYYTFKEFLINRKNKVYIIEGNHDKSRRKGSALQSFNLLNNVTIISDISEIEIENNLYLMIPYMRNMEKYESNKPFDFVLSHLTHPKEAFGDEGIDLSYINSNIFIYGHTHTQNLHKNNNQEHIILGTPLATRHGEKTSGNRIIEIKNNNIEYIDIPEFFQYENIEFGDEPQSKENIINISNAPDIKSVYDKYKEYYIRHEGIKIKRTDGNEIEQISFDKDSIKQQFIIFTKENGISKEVTTCGLQYLEEI